MSEGLLFKDITIDKNLTPEEQEIINALWSIDISDLKKSLQEEKISWIDQTFFDAATAFSTYKVQYKEWEKTEDDWGNEVVTESWLVCDETAPQRLKDMLTDKDQNDFAYFIYKTSEFLSIGTENIESEKLNAATVTHLTQLKTEILKQEVVDSQKNKEQVGESEEDIEETPEAVKVENITIDDIAITQFDNGVSKQDILSAIQTLGENYPTLANEIIPLLKTGNVKEIQVKLGMEEGDTVPLYKKADGRFGKRTLENLRAGKVVEPEYATLGGGSWSSEVIRNPIIVDSYAIRNVVNNIQDNNIRTQVRSYIHAKNIKDLQQYIYNKTWGKYPKNSWWPNNRDGILGPSTLQGIKNIPVDKDEENASRWWWPKFNTRRNNSTEDEIKNNESNWASIEVDTDNIFDKVNEEAINNIIKEIKETDIGKPYSLIYPIKADNESIRFVAKNYKDDKKNDIIRYDISNKKIEIAKRWYGLDSSTNSTLGLSLYAEDTRDIWNDKYTMFKKIADKYNEIRREDQKNKTNRKGYKMKSEAHQKTRPGLEDKLGGKDANRVVERATNNQKGKDFIKRWQEQEKIWNKNTTLKDRMLLKLLEE